MREGMKRAQSMPQLIVENASVREANLFRAILTSCKMGAVTESNQSCPTTYRPKVAASSWRPWGLGILGPNSR